MIKITFPANFINERSYVISVLFGEFLGLEFTLKPEDGALATSIRLENGKVLKIEDAFFNKFSVSNDPAEYLKTEDIPTSVVRYQLEESPEKNIVSLFGDPIIEYEDDAISCGMDILASAFFMLTRWEEYVNKDRDLYGRFPAESSVAHKNNFLHRPIVNEYVEVIWHWLSRLGGDQKRRPRQFRFFNTHDIDEILLFEKKLHYPGKVAKAFLLEKRIGSLSHHAKLAVQAILGNDPYFRFDYFMDISEKRDIKSHFFFMAGGDSKYDNGYDISSPQIRKLIQHILERGHIVGIHPSFDTFKNPKLLSSQIKYLREVSNSDVSCGRQHYLRFEPPNTWQHWDDNNMRWDSSLYYSEEEGFRCGVCYTFPVFNFLTRKVLELRERPVTIMDGTLVVTKKQSPEKAFETIKYYLDKTKQYSGDFVLLWHNSSFEYLHWKNYGQVYEDIMDSTFG